MSAARDDSSDHVQSLARGLSVIRAFGADTPEFTLSGVAKHTNMTRATARRFVLTLVELGYMTSDGSSFRLTPRVLELGYSYLSGLSIPEVALPHVERLVAELEDSSELAVLDGQDVVYLLRVPSPRIVTTAIAVGARKPAHLTSLGRVLLADLPPAERERFLASVELSAPQPSTIVDRAELRAELERVAEQRWAIIDGELEEGLRAVSVAIRDRSGRAIAAVNLNTHSARRELSALREELLPRLQSTAAEIERDLHMAGADRRAVM
jgi:IclR family transcriptional regulator, pca regulon regulatory protein